MKISGGRLIRVVSITTFVTLLALGGPARSLPAEEACVSDEMVYRYFNFPSYVIGGAIEPHWLEDGHSFWFAATDGDERVYRRVDPIRNILEPFTPPTRESAEPPDRKWTVKREDHQLWLYSGGNRLRALTDDGEEDFDWSLTGWPPPPAELWSPDGTRMVVRRSDFRDAPRVPIVSYDLPRETVTWHKWANPQGPLSELTLFELPSGARRTVALPPTRDEIYLLTWHPNGRFFYVLAVEGVFGRRIDLYEVDADNAQARLLVTERAREGGLWGHPEQQSLFTLLPERGQFVWKSFRDGWSQLYLYDLDGALVRRLTDGDFPVERVVTADETEGWLYFGARADPERIYDTHLYRVDFDGRNFKQLTEAPGQHEIRIFSTFLHQIRFSPSKKFFLDSHSSPQRPPRVDLRRADGTLVRTIAEANVEALKSLQWKPPEEFTVLAADGKTTLHGVLYKPFDFDPSHVYPVINFVYGLIDVQRVFVPGWLGIEAQALAQLGFITYVVDPRGGPGRSKAFQDAGYGDVGAIEIADQVAALEQLAQTHPYLDLDRVGIFGHSYGGYMAVRGMLSAPDVYSVGVASAPISNHTDHYNTGKVGPIPPDLEGDPPGTNVPLAKHLQGKLLIIHGTADWHVPIGHTMRLVKAFIEAGKPIDLLIMPDENHGSPGISVGYGWDARLRYFCEHLSTDVELTALAQRRFPKQPQGLPTRPQVRERIAITVSSEILADYVGTYGPGPFGDFEVTLADNQLMLELRGADKVSAVAESETDFFIKRHSRPSRWRWEENLQIEFVRGDNGAVKHFVMRQGSAETTVPRK